MTAEKSIVQVAMNGRGVLGRRAFLKGVGLGAAGLSFTDLMAVRADDLRKRGMSCILLWMGGGPSQFDTFDPKPDHANGAGTETIETAVPGVRIARGWEKTAAAMGDIALVRSMTNKEGNHARATYQLHTGYTPTGTVRHPAFGSVAAAELGDPRFDMPHIVSIGGPTVGAGLLGVAYEPFVVNDPNKLPRNVPLPAGVTPDRLTRRLGLLLGLESAGFASRAAGGEDRVREHTTVYRAARDMVLSKHARAFDLSDEPEALRDAYGRTNFGQGCLLARRLVEVGVTFVEVRSNGWDTHNQAKDRLAKLSGEVDPAFATLIGDLKSRGKLDSTLVLWMGEFGRTPRLTGDGRGHYPRAFNLALSGGGIKGGQVIGQTSADGTEVKDRPVAVNDLLATLCQALKIDPKKENMSPQGRPIKVVDGGKAVGELLG